MKRCFSLIGALALGATGAVAVYEVMRANAGPADRTSIAARDGWGDPVEWFFVLKLPFTVFPTEQVELLSALGALPAKLELFAKSAADHVLPWLFAAAELGSDLAVASWLDTGYGTPSLCRGDNYTPATNQGCLVDAPLNISLASGGAPYSVENALAGQVHLPASAGGALATARWS
jgi:hypothetical protein